MKVRYRKEGIGGERCSLYGRRYGVPLTQLAMVRNKRGAFWSYRQDRAACTRDPAPQIRVVLLSSDSDWMGALLRLSAA